MKVNLLNKTVTGTNGTVEMESGDHLSIGFRNKAGEFQVVTVSVQGSTCVVTHEQSNDSLVIRPSATQYVKG